MRSSLAARMSGFFAGPLAYCLIAGLAVILPCVPLLHLDAKFYGDWYNHEWLIGYYGEYFRRHGMMPAALNTNQVGGMALPLFYGTLTYPLLGVVSSFLAPAVVIRVATIGVFVVQYHCVAQALSRLHAPLLIARGVPCLVIWAIYPLTNLYNRSALSEFFATSLLVCALSLLVLLVTKSSYTRLRRYACWMMLCLTLSAGAHPITALFGLPFFLGLAIFFWRMLRQDKQQRRAIVTSLSLWVVMALVCLAPWLYAVVNYSEHLAIRQASKIYLDSQGFDHWLTRFYPIPLDPRVQPGIPLARISTPFLDAQINIPLLVLLLATSTLAVLSVRGFDGRNKFIWAIGIAFPLFAFFTWISLSQQSYHFLPPMVGMIQFGYRAVTYQNLALLFGVFLLAMADRDIALRRRRLLSHPVLGVIMAVCLLLSMYGLIIKCSHALAVRTRDGRGQWILNKKQRQALISLPSQYYGAGDYATPQLIGALNPTEREHLIYQRFSFDSGAHFGIAIPTKLSLVKGSWIGTNIEIFPWMRFVLDGREIASSDLRGDGTQAAVRLPAGPHSLWVEFAPKRQWLFLRTISFLALGAWIVWATGVIRYVGRYAHSRLSVRWNSRRFLS